MVGLQVNTPPPAVEPMPVAPVTPVTTVDDLARLFGGEGSGTTTAPENPVARTAAATQDTHAPAPAVAPAADGTIPAVTTTEPAADINWFSDEVPEGVIAVQPDAQIQGLPADFLTSFGSELGIENIPTTPDEFKATVKAHIEGVRTAISSSPYQQTQQVIGYADNQLSFTDDDLVYVDLKSRMGKDFSDEQIDDLMEKFQPDDVKRKADAIRAELNTIKTKATDDLKLIETQQIDAQTKAAADAIKAKNDTLTAIRTGLDKLQIEGKPLQEPVKAYLMDYYQKQWMQDLDNPDTENFWTGVMYTNPKTRAMLISTIKANAAKQAVSDYIKNNLQGAQLNMGNGAGFVPGAQRMATADDLGRIFGNSN